MRHLTWSITVVSILSLFGCSPGLVGSGPHPAEQTAQFSGPRYNLAKDVIVVDATITNAVSRSISDSLKIETEVVKREAVECLVTLRTVADPREFYILNIKPAGSKDQNLALQLSEHGLLNSVNYSSTDRTGEIVTNVAKSVASVAGAFVGFRDGTDDGTADAVFALTSLSGSPSAAEARVLFRRLPKTALYFIKERGYAKVLIAEQILAQIAAADARSQLETALKNAVAAPDEAAAKDADRKTARVRDQLKFAEDTLAARTSAFSSALEAFLSEQDLGKTTKSVKGTWIIELPDLPNYAVVAGKITRAEVLTALGSFVRAKQIFEETGVVVTYDPNVPPLAPTPATGPVVAAENPPTKVTTTPAKKELTKIYFRDAQLSRVCVFATNSVPDDTKKTFEEQLRLVEERMLPVIDPRTQPASVEFDSKAFSNQSLQLTFSAQGRLTGITQGATSPLAGAAASAANTLIGARDELAASLTKAKEIQATTQQIAVNRLQARIDDLTKQKQLVDARVSLDATNANAADKVEKLRIDQEIELVNQQLALAKAQAQASPIGTTITDIERLKLEVEVLKQRIEVHKQQAELNRQQLGGAGTP